MLDPVLDIGNAPTSVALVPSAVELFGCGPELHDEVAGQVLQRGLATLFAPQPEQRGLVAAHDDAGVRAADERAAILIGFSPYVRLHTFLRAEKWRLLVN